MLAIFSGTGIKYRHLFEAAEPFEHFFIFCIFKCNIVFKNRFIAFTKLMKGISFHLCCPFCVKTGCLYV